MEKNETKTEDGKAYTADAFAFVPDRSKPSTWKLRLFSSPEDAKAGRPSVRHTAAAAMALSSSGFRGNRVKLPSGARESVRRRVARAWIKARTQQGDTVSAKDLPNSLRGALSKRQEIEVAPEVLSACERLAVASRILKAHWQSDQVVLDALSDSLDAEGAQDLPEGYGLFDVLNDVEYLKTQGIEFAVPQTKASKNPEGSRPAPPEDRIHGSSQNDSGSASKPSGDIKVSEATEKTLREKMEEHNKEHGESASKKVTLGMLKAVYRRGAGAFSVSHRKGMTRGQWAFARVNAFLKLVRSGKPDNSNYTQDNDLLPKEHKRSTRKADLSTGQLTAQGGLKQPAQGGEMVRTKQPAVGEFKIDDGDGGMPVGTYKAERENCGIFLRIPGEIAKDLPAKRGDDDSPLHATLAYVGELDREEFGKLLMTAQNLLKAVPPCEVELTDKGMFRSDSNGMEIEYLVPRMKAGDGRTFEALHDYLMRGLKEAGFDVEPRDPFKPHVTVSYNEPGTGAAKLEDGIGGTFKMEELEVWGGNGGDFGRVAFKLGTGEEVRRVDSTKRGADVVKEGFRPPAGVARAAQRGLDYRDELGRGGTAVGIARARDLSNRKSVSLETIGRMVSFFARHGAQDADQGPKGGEEPDNGYIAWLLWGGDPGKRWAESIWEREKDKINKREIHVLKADNEEERTVFGIVLEPEVVDSQDDIYSEDEIRKTAYLFMEKYQQFGLMHKDIVPAILPLESYIAPVDFEINGQKIKKGTWLLRVRVLDDGIWRRVKSGELTGFSIGGSALRTPDTVKLA